MQEKRPALPHRPCNALRCTQLMAWALTLPDQVMHQAAIHSAPLHAQQGLRCCHALQNKMPGPPHRARNALLYMALEAGDLAKPEVARLITMAGLDSAP